MKKNKHSQATSSKKQQNTCRNGQKCGGNQAWEFSRFLEVNGLYMEEIVPDGNCLFRAFADQLFRNPMLHFHERKLAVKYLHKHRSEFESFIEDDEPFEKYSARMMRDSIWGGHLELQMLSLCHEVNVALHHEDGSPIYFLSNFPDSAPCVQLSYHDGQHYNSIRTHTKVNTRADMNPLLEALLSLNDIRQLIHPADADDSADATTNERKGSVDEKRERDQAETGVPRDDKVDAHASPRGVSTPPLSHTVVSHSQALKQGGHMEDGAIAKEDPLCVPFSSCHKQVKYSVTDAIRRGLLSSYSGCASHTHILQSLYHLLPCAKSADFICARLRPGLLSISPLFFLTPGHYNTRITADFKILTSKKMLGRRGSPKNFPLCDSSTGYDHRNLEDSLGSRYGYSDNRSVRSKGEVSIQEEFAVPFSELSKVCASPPLHTEKIRNSPPPNPPQPPQKLHSNTSSTLKSASNRGTSGTHQTVSRSIAQTPQQHPPENISSPTPTTESLPQSPSASPQTPKPPNNTPKSSTQTPQHPTNTPKSPTHTPSQFAQSTPAPLSIFHPFMNDFLLLLRNRHFNAPHTFSSSSILPPHELWNGMKISDGDFWDSMLFTSHTLSASRHLNPLIPHASLDKPSVSRSHDQHADYNEETSQVSSSVSEHLVISAVENEKPSTFSFKIPEFDAFSKYNEDRAYVCENLNDCGRNTLPRSWWSYPSFQLYVSEEYEFEEETSSEHTGGEVGVEVAKSTETSAQSRSAPPSSLPESSRQKHKKEKFNVRKEKKLQRELNRREKRKTNRQVATDSVDSSKTHTPANPASKYLEPLASSRKPDTTKGAANNTGPVENGKKKSIRFI